MHKYFCIILTAFLRCTLWISLVIIILFIFCALRIYFHPEIEEWSFRRLEAKINQVHGTNNIMIVDHYYAPSIWSLPYLECQDGLFREFCNNWRSLAWNPFPQLYYIKISSANFSDLTTLKRLPLRELDISNTGVCNLSPIASMQLDLLMIANTPSAMKPLPLWLDNNQDIMLIINKIE